MTTWVNDGFAGELFKLAGSFMPPPPPGVQPPPLWGVEEHVEEAFAAADASPTMSARPSTSTSRRSRTPCSATPRISGRS